MALKRTVIFKKILWNAECSFFPESSDGDHNAQSGGGQDKFRLLGLMLVCLFFKESEHHYIAQTIFSFPGVPLPGLLDQVVSHICLPRKWSPGGMVRVCELHQSLTPAYALPAPLSCGYRMGPKRFVGSRQCLEVGSKKTAQRPTMLTAGHKPQPLPKDRILSLLVILLEEMLGKGPVTVFWQRLIAMNTVVAESSKKPLPSAPQ